MDSGKSTRALPRVGFPIRKSRDQQMVSSFPGLIAAAHVLHRLLAPRHPPCALLLLIMKNTCFCHYGVFKVRASSSARRYRPRGRSLKTQQRDFRRARHCSRSSEFRTTYGLSRVHNSDSSRPSLAINGSEAPTGVIAPASLERR
jgi:hypothetical protein